MVRRIGPKQLGPGKFGQGPNLPRTVVVVVVVVLFDVVVLVLGFNLEN